MSKITIEYDVDDLKILVAEILATKLYQQMGRQDINEVKRRAKELAEKNITDQIIRDTQII